MKTMLTVVAVVGGAGAAHALLGHGDWLALDDSPASLRGGSVVGVTMGREDDVYESDNLWLLSVEFGRRFYTRDAFDISAGLSADALLPGGFEFFVEPYLSAKVRIAHDNVALRMNLVEVVSQYYVSKFPAMDAALLFGFGDGRFRTSVSFRLYPSSEDDWFNRQLTIASSAAFPVAQGYSAGACSQFSGYYGEYEDYGSVLSFGPFLVIDQGLQQSEVRLLYTVIQDMWGITLQWAQTLR